MRRSSRVALTLALVLATATPSLATVAAIATTAPLQNHSEESVKSALLAAVEAAVTGAAAMGLPWVQISKTLILEDAVAVQILATDTDPRSGNNEETPGTNTQPGASSDQFSESEF